MFSLYFFSGNISNGKMSNYEDVSKIYYVNLIFFLFKLFCKVLQKKNLFISEDEVIKNKNII